MKWIALHQKHSVKHMSIDGRGFYMLVADTWLKRAFGLMYRKPFNLLGINLPVGMLFIYPKPGRHSIWALNMQFPIDVYWFDAEKGLVDSSLNIQPVSSIFSAPQYFPQDDALYILELPAGTLKQSPKKIVF